MNLHWELFQQRVNYKDLYFFDAKRLYVSEALPRCQGSDDEATCLNLHERAFETVFNHLSSQLERERILDMKYEKMARFKALRGDADSQYLPFKF